MEIDSRNLFHKTMEQMDQDLSNRRIQSTKYKKTEQTEQGTQFKPKRKADYGNKIRKHGNERKRRIKELFDCSKIKMES